MKILHGGGYTIQERNTFTSEIQRNTIDAIVSMIHCYEHCTEKTKSLSEETRVYFTLLD